MRENNDDFFDKLYRTHYRDLVMYAFRLTCERNFSEEIVQDAFTEAYIKLEKLKRHENPIGWLYVTVMNISKAYLRDFKDIKSNLPLHDNDAFTIDQESGEMFLQNYLSEDETLILLKFYREKSTILDIAHEYGISVSACKMRLKRARDKLKRNYLKNIL